MCRWGHLCNYKDDTGAAGDAVGDDKGNPTPSAVAASAVAASAAANSKVGVIRHTRMPECLCVTSEACSASGTLR